MSERKKNKKPAARAASARPTAKVPSGKSQPRPAKAATKAKGPAAPADSPMNVDLLQQLVTLMSTHDLNSVKLRDGDRKITLTRGGVLAAAPVAYAQPAAPVAAAPAPAPAAAPAAAAAAPAEDANLVAIKSPMVGTFYSRPSPDAAPFVSVGTVVDEEADVCVIEAMKVFNNIKAETRGTIAKVLIQDRQPVEFGTVLFLVKPS